jgi:hypothetical protein
MVVRKMLLEKAPKNSVFGTVSVGRYFIRETVGLRIAFLRSN